MRIATLAAIVLTFLLALVGIGFYSLVSPEIALIHSIENEIASSKEILLDDDGPSREELIKELESVGSKLVAVSTESLEMKSLCNSQEAKIAELQKQIDELNESERQKDIEYKANFEARYSEWLAKARDLYEKKTDPAIAENSPYCDGQTCVIESSDSPPVPNAKASDFEPKTQPQPSVQSRTPTISMYTSPGCIYCDRWEREAKPEWERLGWVVNVRQLAEYQGQSSTRLVPLYVIDDGWEVWEVVGYLTKDNYSNKASLRGQFDPNSIPEQPAIVSQDTLQSPVISRKYFSQRSKLRWRQ